MDKGLEIRYQNEKFFRESVDIIINWFTGEFKLTQDDIVQALALAELKIAERDKKK